MSELGSGIAQPGPEDAGKTLLVADSFRVRLHPRTGAAEVRGWDRHAARFARSALALLARAEWTSAATVVLPEPTAEEEALRARVDAFLADARERIAEYGEGFPRLELRAPAEPGGDPEFGLSLRPLPELRGSIELRSVRGIRLERPEHKGPNLARLTALNRSLGAEALLLDAAGLAVEGATTSLVWWMDGTDESGRVIGAHDGAPLARVASVTEDIVSEAARHRLVGTEPHRSRTGSLSPGRPALAELQASEVWAVNALHGIRVVTRIDGARLPAPREDRLRWFRNALDRSWEPVAP